MSLSLSQDISAALKTRSWQRLIRAYSNSVTSVVEKVGVIKRVLQQEFDTF